MLISSAWREGARAAAELALKLGGYVASERSWNGAVCADDAGEDQVLAPREPVPRQAVKMSPDSDVAGDPGVVLQLGRVGLVADCVPNNLSHHNHYQHHLGLW